METWWFLIAVLFICAFFNFFIFCPSGTCNVLLVLNRLFLSGMSFSEITREFISRNGPVMTLKFGCSRSLIVIGSHSLAHFALVQKGAIFSNRPYLFLFGEIMGSNHLTISTAPYGPIWRLLRRNLTSQILHPSHIKSQYSSHARSSVLQTLIRRLSGTTAASTAVEVMDHFNHAVFCLLVLMCFGNDTSGDEKQVKLLEEVISREIQLLGNRSWIFDFWPKLGKVVLRHQWKELLQLRRDQEHLIVPLIISRSEFLKRNQAVATTSIAPPPAAYVDTLLELELPEEKKKLNQGEIVSLCLEFFIGGYDTTATSLQWIMASLVNYPRVQAKLYEEIKTVKGVPPSMKLQKHHQEKFDVVNEEEIQRMPYLKAVVLEGLRLHPPGHFLIPRTAAQQVELEGYTIPKDATVHFMVAHMGLDPKVWEEPVEFKPERFFSGGGDDGGQTEVAEFEVTRSSKETKMMPFGAGRRACPGYRLALMHLEYFVANLIWYFQWTAQNENEGVDMSEDYGVTTGMKNPLRTHIRRRNGNPE